MPSLGVEEWLLLAVAALFVGFAKTAISGTGSIAVALFALVLPARESTGTLLLLLIAGDLFAVAFYRRHASWRLIRRLFPGVAAGVVLGTVFVSQVDDAVMRRVIGLLLLVLAGLQLLTRGGRLAKLLGDPGEGPRRTGHVVGAAVAGVAAGFATMVANAAGAVMTLYLLLSGLTKLEFLGTTAWFFLVVNLFKLPFSAGLGLIEPGALLLDLTLLPVVGIGAVAGLLLIRRLDQEQFERAALVLVAVSVVPLLV